MNPYSIFAISKAFGSKLFCRTPVGAVHGYQGDKRGSNCSTSQGRTGSADGDYWGREDEEAQWVKIDCVELWDAARGGRQDALSS